MNTFPTTFSNPCTRCGKNRIDGKTWNEEVVTLRGKSIVTHILTICPDPECQKLVEEKLAIEKVRSDQIKKAFDDRVAEKRNARSQIAFAKKKKVV